jgi:apolipoprotein N-acyltransferase
LEIRISNFFIFSGVKQHHHNMLSLAFGSTIGGLAWIPLSAAWQLTMLWLLVITWLLTTNRKSAYALLFSYYLLTGREAIQIIHRFTGLNEIVGLCVLLAYSAAIALIWTFAWQRRPLWRFCGLVLILIATSIPPFGGFIYGSPLLAAGWLFPGMGFVGIALLVMSWGSVFAFAVLPKSNMRMFATFIAGCLTVASVVANVNYSEPDSNFVYALNAKMPLYPVKIEDQHQRHLELTKAALAALEQPYSIVVMPEEIGGFWQPRYAWLWEDVSKAYEEANKTLIVGFDTKPDQYANTAKVFGLNPDGASDVLAKVPAPIGGWKPWSTIHAPARWSSPATIAVNGRDLTFIFCWEELVPWPWLAAAGLTDQGDQKPRSVVVMANHWFAKDLDIGDSQARSTQAWSRLFGWSYQRVVNEP